MTVTLNKHRLLLGAGAFALVTLGGLLLARLMLTGLIVNALLEMAGASEIKFNVAQASPWRVVVEDIDFQMRTQPFSAKRVTFARRHWWTPSLGAVRVEQARVPLTIDGSDTNPWSWSTYKNGQASVQPWQAPLEELSVDGKFVVQASALPAQELRVQIDARLTPQKTWEARVQAAGPGLSLQAEASYDVARDELAFKLPAASLDLKTWQDFVKKWS